MPRVTLDLLRRYTVARTFFEPTTLRRALRRLGYVQADPIRAPARAQDLILRQRVRNYRVGDLESRYPELEIEEDFFVNYGFVTRNIYELMHPRSRMRPWSAVQTRRARAILEFIRERGTVHPRDVEQHFAHGRVVNYWGGTSNATTHLLDGMHYRGLLRVARRERGIRVYAAQDTREAIRDPELRRARLDALIDVLVRVYAPLPRVTLAWLVRRLRDAAPQWTGELGAALTRTRERLSRATVDGIEWYWPADEHISEYDSDFDRVRLLTPFDPLVWDRTRFEALWGWAYRFEAYTPVAKRKLGYYALPLLWQDRVIGWGNVNVAAGELDCQLGFVKAHPKQRSFARALEADLAALKRFVAAG